MVLHDRSTDSCFYVATTRAKFFRGLNLSNIAAVVVTIALIGVVVWKYYNEREDR